MSMDKARQVYDTIVESEKLQEEFEGLESEAEVIKKALEIADIQGIDASREEIEALHEELAEQAEDMDEDELQDIAGGEVSRGGDCALNSQVPFL